MILNTLLSDAAAEECVARFEREVDGWWDAPGCVPLRRVEGVVPDMAPRYRIVDVDHADFAGALGTAAHELLVELARVPHGPDTVLAHLGRRPVLVLRQEGKAVRRNATTGKREVRLAMFCYWMDK
jgi:hypothetical protein